MNIVERVKGILLSPKTEWIKIEAEQSTAADIYRGYLVYLAAIPAIAGFIGLSLVGMSGMGFSYKVPIGTGLVNMIVGFILMLAMIYVIALIVDALAPTFKGQKNMLSALKLVAYGSTAGMVVGIFQLLPALSILALLGALYSLYLIYIGLPVLMKCPQEKALPYTAVIVVAGIIVGVVVAAVTAIITPNPMKGAMSQSGTVAIKTPGGEINLDTRKMEEMAKRMEAAGKSGDPAAAMKAAGEVFAAVTGAGTRKPAEPETLKSILPEAISGMPRVAYEAQTGSPMGIHGSTATARYREGDRTVKIEIIDAGNFAGVLAFAGWMNFTGEREDGASRERTYKEGKRTIHEKVRKDGPGAEFAIVLENGVMVQIEGRNVELNALKSLAGGLDLARLERANP
ncbi:MAG: Yip1 family protein [Burkholderiales bacterium]